MRALRLGLLAAPLLLAATAIRQPEPVDWATVARIREEGLQHSQVMEFEGYIADVLGARLTNSRDMIRAQTWLMATMDSIGLSNVTAEPFMDYGVTWDNEFTSLHLLEPDYQPMVGYPVAHTPGTNGQVTATAIVAELRTREDLERFRGRLKGMAVLISPPAVIDLAPLTNGVPRRSAAELEAIQNTTIAPLRAPSAGNPRNPDLISAAERMQFFKEEGVAALLQCESGWLGAVRGFSRPGSQGDRWSLAGNLASPPIIAITPEHYNRMYRILKRGIPVKVGLEVRNEMGDTVIQARNILGEIPGSDLKDQIVMMGAHFDSWHASPNASDNASGVAVVLEAARILKTIGAKPRRTIRIALWSGEEQGLFGSRAYVARHFGNPRDPKVGEGPEYKNLSAYFNQDYGSGQYLGIYLQGNEAARGMFTSWMEPFRDLGMTVVSNQSLGSTDHVPFDDIGLPGFQFLQDHTPGQGGHTNLDFYDTIQSQDLMKNAVIMAAYVWHAAISDSMVPRKLQR